MKTKMNVSAKAEVKNVANNAKIKKENVMKNELEIIFEAGKKIGDVTFKAAKELNDSVFGSATKKEKTKMKKEKVSVVAPVVEAKKERKAKVDVSFESDKDFGFKAASNLKNSVRGVEKKDRKVKAEKVDVAAVADEAKKERRSMKTLEELVNSIKKVKNEKSAAKIAKEYFAKVGEKIGASNIRYVVRHLNNEVITNAFAAFKK
jgi:hypothetical protein